MHFGEELLYQEVVLVVRWEAELVVLVVLHLRLVRLVRYHLVGHHLPLTPVAQR